MNSKKFTGNNLDYIGFPLGGIGAGMYNVEGNGSFSAFSIRNAPNTNLEPCLFSAVTVKGDKNCSRVIESKTPKYKVFGGALAPLAGKATNAGTKANGIEGKTYGLPRFKDAEFSATFPFANISFKDDKFPLETSLKAWSPFTPPNADDSSYPLAFLEYTFKNNTDEKIDAVYYYNSMNFMAYSGEYSKIINNKNGFTLCHTKHEKEPWLEGCYSANIVGEDVKVNTAMFRGGWFDTLTMLWNDIEKGATPEKERTEESVQHSVGGNLPGGSMAVEFSLNPGECKTITVNTCWFVADSSLRVGHEFEDKKSSCSCNNERDLSLERYKPWYTTKFSSIDDVIIFAENNRDRLYKESKLFSDTFYNSSLPEEVIEAAAANMTIIKSPTVLRQTDGRLWCWEGCCDAGGCCAGSCTHVWNYAQALCHLFPELERGLRETEFFNSQNADGHQAFRASLPIGEADHGFHAASDGQLGGIIKLYRDFTISGDVEWLKKFWGQAKSSINYCINTWDKTREGVLKEPHHNTYDIEFWGADGMCSSFYIGACAAMVKMGEILGEDVSEYEEIYTKGVNYLNEKLYNGEYYYQEVQWEGLEAKLPEVGDTGVNDKITSDAAEFVKKFGPKYQYGTGCISDGVLGFWLAQVSGLGIVCDEDKIKSHLNSVYKYNFKTDLTEHANPQRPGYCLSDEQGLLLCTWPNGNKPALPFVYSDEVWTGIEYQVASHLVLMGETEKALNIVKAVRSRYDGDVRNPFDEYECGHWYARAMASYALIESYSGIKYNAYTKTLTINPQIKGDFNSFISTNTGYGTAGIKDGKPFINVVSGKIDIEKIV